MVDLQDLDSAQEIRPRPYPPHPSASPISTLPMLASTLHIGLLPWVQGSLQRVLRMICGNGLLLPLSSLLALRTQMARWPPRAPWLALGQILWAPLPASEPSYPYSFSYPFLASHSDVFRPSLFKNSLGLKETS